MLKGLGAGGRICPHMLPSGPGGARTPGGGGGGDVVAKKGVLEFPISGALDTRARSTKVMFRRNARRRSSSMAVQKNGERCESSNLNALEPKWLRTSPDDPG